ncbi:MAG: phosphoribosylformylglycinamidine synthase subunit PurS [Geminicoccaceae bacterium]
MQARISIRFRPGVLDPEATAIQRSLHGLGFAEVEAVAKVKVIELTLAGTDRATAETRLRQMCEKPPRQPGDRDLRDRARRLSPDSGPAWSRICTEKAGRSRVGAASRAWITIRASSTAASASAFVRRVIGS